MDLNLVRTFVVIYEAKSLTVAAERLFVTQSAVSQSLARMREQLDDPLFERAGREMRPSALAEALFPSFHRAVVEIDRAMETVHGFNAASTTRTFRIALSELGEIGWLPAIFDAAHAQAPHARIDVAVLDVDELPAQLGRGSVDLAITPAQLPRIFDRTHIKTQAYGVAMSTTNPLAHGEMTLEGYRGAPRVAVVSDSGAHLLNAVHDRVGAVPGALLSVQHFATLPLLLGRSTELIATIPRSIAEGWAVSWPLVIRDLPFVMPAVELNLYRRTSSQHTGALDWFYTTVARAVAGSAGEFSVIQANA